MNFFVDTPTFKGKNTYMGILYIYFKLVVIYLLVEREKNTIREKYAVF